MTTTLVEWVRACIHDYPWHYRGSDSDDADADATYTLVDQVYVYFDDAVSRNDELDFWNGIKGQGTDSDSDSGIITIDRALYSTFVESHAILLQYKPLDLVIGNDAAFFIDSNGRYSIETYDVASRSIAPSKLKWGDKGVIPWLHCGKKQV
jgi:hypothetical protein